MNRKRLLILASSILIVSFGALVLEKSHLINFYTKPVNNTVSSIDYNPPTEEDKTYNDQIKQNITDTTDNDQQFTASITRATQNPDTKALIVRAITTSSVSQGTCTLELSQNNNSPDLTRQTTLSLQNTVAVCNGFDIPQSELPGLGEWAIKVTITGGENSASATQTVMIEK